MLLADVALAFGLLFQEANGPGSWWVFANPVAAVKKAKPPNSGTAVQQSGDQGEGKDGPKKEAEP